MFQEPECFDISAPFPAVSGLRHDTASLLIIVGSLFQADMWVFFGPIPAKGLKFRSHECVIVELLSGIRLLAEDSVYSVKVPLLSIID
jgi:hypothetical protein